ncbi:MAG: hypothetical protein KAT46_03830 [Deltaproteobacteria bacterium]|nr:hypothetical protein [Deltaproteobacteria bacterium]
MSKLPYSNSKADPTRAQGRIRKILLKFGVSSIGFNEDIENTEVVVNFKYRDYPVVVPVNYGKLADLYIEESPWTYRMRKTRSEYETRMHDTAYRASFSLLEDFIKASITTVEMGMFSFEEVFVSHFVTPDGVRLGEVFKHRLPDFINGQAALGTGK